MSDERHADALAARIEELEGQAKKLRKSNRENQICMVILLLAIGSVWFSEDFVEERYGVRTNGYVQARQLTIVDDAGTHRAELNAITDGVQLVLFDASGRPQLKIARDGQVSSIRMGSGDGRRTEWFLDETSCSSLYFAETSGATRVLVGVSPEGQAGLCLRDAQGDTQATLLSCDDSDSGLVVYDQTEKPRIILGMHPTGIALANFNDATGQTRLMFGQSPDGWPSIDMLASDGSPRATLQSPDEWTCLTLKGPRGKAAAKVWVDEDDHAQVALSNPDGFLNWSALPEPPATTEADPTESEKESAADQSDDD